MRTPGIAGKPPGRLLSSDDSELDHTGGGWLIEGDVGKNGPVTKAKSTRREVAKHAPIASAHSFLEVEGSEIGDVLKAGRNHARVLRCYGSEGKFDRMHCPAGIGIRRKELKVKAVLADREPVAGIEELRVHEGFFHTERAKNALLLESLENRHALLVETQLGSPLESQTLCPWRLHPMHSIRAADLSQQRHPFGLP